MRQHPHSTPRLSNVPRMTSTTAQRDREDPVRIHTRYTFGEVSVSVIVDNEDVIWFKGVDLAKALEYEAVDCISTIEKVHCRTYEELTRNLKSYRGIPNIQPRTTFVNEIGTNVFLIRSRKPKVEEFAAWVWGYVVPCVRKNNRHRVDAVERVYLKTRMSVVEQLEAYLKTRISQLEQQVKELESERAALLSDLRRSVADNNKKCLL